MALGKGKKRIVITIEETLKEKLEFQALVEKRSLANLVNKVMEDYLDSLED